MFVLFSYLLVIFSHGRPQGGGGKSRPSPPPLENQEKNFVAILGAFLLLFLHIWGRLLAMFLLILGAFFIMWGPFCYFVLHDGGLLWACLPLTKISAGAHVCSSVSVLCSPFVVPVSTLLVHTVDISEMRFMAFSRLRFIYYSAASQL